MFYSANRQKATNLLFMLHVHICAFQLQMYAKHSKYVRRYKERHRENLDKESSDNLFCPLYNFMLNLNERETYRLVWKLQNIHKFLSFQMLIYCFRNGEGKKMEHANLLSDDTILTFIYEWR